MADKLNLDPQELNVDSLDVEELDVEKLEEVAGGDINNNCLSCTCPAHN